MLIDPVLIGPVLIDAAGIAALIPHAGAMCLLDGVLSWDAQRIQCTATSHRSPNNPMRYDNRLGILCGVEYAAQAMAVHGVLAASGSETAGVRAGYLASLRAMSRHDDWLDHLPGPLIVEAERLHGDAERAIYAFRLMHQSRCVLEGRTAVVLAPAVLARIVP